MTHIENVNEILNDDQNRYRMQAEQESESNITLSSQDVPLQTVGNEATGIPHHISDNPVDEGLNTGHISKRSIFRFFDLPSELRDQIYREALLTQNAVSRVPNPDFFVFDDPEGPFHMVDEEGPKPRSIYDAGDVLHENIHLERSTCNMALLRVNQQMHQEAKSVFLENIWVGIHINKPGFARQLKDRGYNVQTEGWGRKGKVKRALDINIHIGFFPRKWEREGKDSFLISLSAIGQLPRAFHTVDKFEYFNLTFSVRPDFRGRFSPDSELIKVFSQLQVVPLVKVPQNEFAFKAMAFAMSVVNLDLRQTNGLVLNFGLLKDHILSRVHENFSAAQEAYRNALWYKAADECELSLAYMIGTLLAHGGRICGFFDQAFANIFCETLLILAEAKMRIGAYACVIKYATHFLIVCSDNSGGVATMLYLRGRAYAAMGEHSMAQADYTEMAKRRIQPEEMATWSSWANPPIKGGIPFRFEDEVSRLRAQFAEDPSPAEK